MHEGRVQAAVEPVAKGRGLLSLPFHPLGLPVAWPPASLSRACEKSFHFRQPSKSMRACMQPHAMTFLESQPKLTGWTLRVSMHLPLHKWRKSRREAYLG